MTNLLNNAFRILLAAALYFTTEDTCLSRDILFRKASRNYDEEGRLGVVYRRELEARMFTHGTWLVRLYCGRDEPDIDETIEMYSKIDGSRWLEHSRAIPSLSRIIRERVWLGEKFDLEKKLAAIAITRHQVVLPANIADGIEDLWRTMLSRLPPEPKQPETHTLYLSSSVFVAFGRENGSVVTGTVAMAGYGNPSYRAFAGIVDDLITLCDGKNVVKDRVDAELAGKMRSLKERLASSH